MKRERELKKESENKERVKGRESPLRGTQNGNTNYYTKRWTQKVTPKGYLAYYENTRCVLRDTTYLKTFSALYSLKYIFSTKKPEKCYVYFDISPI